MAWEVARQRAINADRDTSPKVTKLKGRIDCPNEVALPEAAPMAGGLVEVSQSLGVNFQHLVGPLGTYFMPESTGTGGALADLNGDGLLDLYLINSGPSPLTASAFPSDLDYGNRLWLQRPDGTFQETTAASGLGDRGYGSGCAVGDVNNDGALDVFVTNYGPDQLFLNHGDGTFQNVTETCGIAENDWGAGAAFVDINRDGWLDLVVVNYTADPTYGHSIACGFPHGLVSYCGPHKFQPTIDRLYRNDGLQTDKNGHTTVHFTDITTTAGLESATTFGFGVVICDVNRDGWPDIFIANDGAPNRLWINQQNETFLEEAVARGVAYNRRGVSEAGMGVALGDVNDDGLFDLIISHLSTESTTLYTSNEQGYFADDTALRRIDVPTMRHTGWGIALIDLDLDGWLDAPMVNGLVVPCHSGFPFHGEDEFQKRNDTIDNPEAFWRDYADTNLLLMGNQTGQFVASPQLAGDFIAQGVSGRSLIHGDLENDGDLDLVVTNCGGPARIYRNDMTRHGHWLHVRLTDSATRRDAYGAELTIVTKSRRFVRFSSPAGSYLASHDPRMHFGLGDASAYEQLLVRWPDGPVESSLEAFPGGPADREVIIQRGTGRVITDLTEPLP